MHSDFAPGRTFPDFALPDGARTERQLSALHVSEPARPDRSHPSQASG